MQQEVYFHLANRQHYGPNKGKKLHACDCLRQWHNLRAIVGIDNRTIVLNSTFRQYVTRSYRAGGAWLSVRPIIEIHGRAHILGCPCFRGSITVAIDPWC